MMQAEPEPFVSFLTIHRKPQSTHCKLNPAPNFFYNNMKEKESKIVRYDGSNMETRPAYVLVVFRHSIVKMPNSQGFLVKLLLHCRRLRYGICTERGDRDAKVNWHES